MKSLIAFITLIVLSFPALAQTDHEFCSLAADHAEFIMTARQAELSADEVYQRYDNIKDKFTTPDKAMESIQIIIMDAYEQPRFSSEEYINRAITEFRSETYIDCLKVKRGL